MDQFWYTFWMFIATVLGIFGTVFCAFFMFRQGIKDEFDPNSKSSYAYFEKTEFASFFDWLKAIFLLPHKTKNDKRDKIEESIRNQKRSLN